MLLQYTYIVSIAKKVMDDIAFFHEVCLCNGELRTTMGVFNDSSRYSIIAANSNIATSNNSHAHVEDIMRCFKPVSGLGTAIQATTTTTWTSTVVEAGSIAESFLINPKSPSHNITKPLAMIFSTTTRQELYFGVRSRDGAHDGSMQARPGCLGLMCHGR